MKLELSETSKLSTIPVSPIMSLFNQFSTRPVLFLFSSSSLFFLSFDTSISPLYTKLLLSWRFSGAFLLFLHWQMALERGEEIHAVFLDLSKAYGRGRFSTPELFYKLSSPGFKDSTMQWFTSFLTNREQRV